MSTRRAPDREGGAGAPPPLKAVSDEDVVANVLKKQREKRDRLVGSAIAAFTALMFASGTVLLASLLNLAPTQNAYVILAARFGGVVVLLGIFVVATGTWWMFVTCASVPTLSARSGESRTFVSTGRYVP